MLAEKQQKEEEERLAKEAKEKEEAEMKVEEAKKEEEKNGEAATGEAAGADGAEKPADGDQIVEKPKDPEPKKRIKRSTSVKEPEEDDYRDTGYFPRPRGNEFMWNFLLPDDQQTDDTQKKIHSVTAAGNYCYALYKQKNEVYSWGMGENYVLGNLDDRNEFTPHKVDPRMFGEKKVLQITCGTQHVVVLAQDSADVEPAAVDFSSFVKVETQIPPKPAKQAEDGDEEEPVIEIPSFAKQTSSLNRS